MDLGANPPVDLGAKWDITNLKKNITDFWNFQ
jgi:hypothetical protein